MSGELVWNGDQIARQIERAVIAATDETTTGAADVAKQLVHVRTHALQESIGIVPAQAQGDLVVGAFGSLDDPGYALDQEYEPPPRGRPYLRPAADQEFPKLGDRIARRLGQ